MTMESRASLIGFKSILRTSGVSIRYTSGAKSGTFVAVPADTVVEADDEDAFTVRQRIRDYLCLRSDIEAIVGAGIVPKLGDEIDETLASFTRTFDVLDLAGEVWRWWDKGYQVFRIHTIEVSKLTTTSDTTTTAGA